MQASPYFECAAASATVRVRGLALERDRCRGVRVLRQQRTPLRALRAVLVLVASTLQDGEYLVRPGLEKA